MGKAELDSSIDYYRVLEISFPSTQVDIRRAFLELARTQHPDKNPGREIEFKAKFQAITTAYDVLKDPILKKTYDQIRPIGRKPVPTPKFTATSKPSPASTRPTAEAAARASAFPRQAKSKPKSAPQSPPKKSQKPHSDPFFDWTPPIPRNKPSASKPSPRYEPSYAKSQFNGPAASSPSYNNSPRRAPTAARTSAYSATRDSTNLKEQKPAAGFKPSVPHSSRPVPNSEAPHTPNFGAQAEKGWWTKSSTAYSTFHAPSSKFSPYLTSEAQPSRPSPFGAQEAKPFTAPPPTSSDDSSSRDTSRKTSADQSHRTTEYNWKSSRGAYQRSDGNTPNMYERPKKEPRSQRPVKASKAEPPSFHAGGHFPESGNNPGNGSHDSSRKTKQFNSSTRNSAGFRGPDVVESSDDESQPVTSETNSDIDSVDNNSPSFSRQDNFPKEHKNGQETFPPEEAIHKTRPGLSTPNSHSQVEPDEAATTPLQKERYSFTFRPSPASSVPGSGSSRKSSGNVPYVRLNKVPVFNFASTTVPFDDCDQPETKDQSATTVEQQFNTKNTAFSNVRSPRSKPDAADHLTEKFSRFDIGNKSSPLRFSFVDQTARSDSTSKSDANDQDVLGAPASNPHFGQAAFVSQGNPFMFQNPTMEKRDPGYIPSFTFPKPTIDSSAIFFSQTTLNPAASNATPIFNFTAPTTLDPASSKTSAGPNCHAPTRTSESASSKAPPIFNFNSSKKTSGPGSSNNSPVFSFVLPQTKSSQTTPARREPFTTGVHGTPTTNPVVESSSSTTTSFGSNHLPNFAPRGSSTFGWGPLPPLPPWDFLRKDPAGLDPESYREYYLAKSAKFDKYFEAWSKYRAVAIWDKDYLTALQTYHKVRTAHGELEQEHFERIQKSPLEKQAQP